MNKYELFALEFWLKVHKLEKKPQWQSRMANQEIQGIFQHQKQNVDIQNKKA